MKIILNAEFDDVPHGASDLCGLLGALISRTCLYYGASAPKELTFSVYCAGEIYSITKSPGYIEADEHPQDKRIREMAEAIEEEKGKKEK